MEDLRRLRADPTRLWTPSEASDRLRATVQHPGQHVEYLTGRVPNDEAAQVFPARDARFNGAAR